MSSENVLTIENNGDIYFMGAGNVGIGASVPGYNLEIEENVATSTPQIAIDQNNVGGDASMLFDAYG
jgi:hypothetical protein